MAHKSTVPGPHARFPFTVINFRYASVANSTRNISILAAILCIHIIGGCHNPPIVMHLGITSTDILQRHANSELWRGNAPIPAFTTGDRIAITECSVEFVTIKQETPTDRQALIGGPIMLSSALVDLSGIFRKRVTFPSEVLFSLPRNALELVTGVLEDRGLFVINPNEVAGCPAYQHLAQSSLERSSPAYHLDPRGSDAGRTNEFLVRSARPLRILPKRCDEVIILADRALREELNADYTLRFRLRVGIYQGRVSLERDSTIRIGCDDGYYKLMSERSVVSSELVAVCDGYEVVSGKIYHVDWPSFRRFAQSMIPCYLCAGLPEPDVSTGDYYVVNQACDDDSTHPLSMDCLP